MVARATLRARQGAVRDRFVCCAAEASPRRDGEGLCADAQSLAPRLEGASRHREVADDNRIPTISERTRGAIRRPGETVRVDGRAVHGIWKHLPSVDLRRGCLRHNGSGVRKTRPAPKLAELYKR